MDKHNNFEELLALQEKRPGINDNTLIQNILDTLVNTPMENVWFKSGCLISENNLGVAHRILTEHSDTLDAEPEQKITDWLDAVWDFLYHPQPFVIDKYGTSFDERSVHLLERALHTLFVNSNKKSIKVLDDFCRINKFSFADYIDANIPKAEKSTWRLAPRPLTYLDDCEKEVDDAYAVLKSKIQDNTSIHTIGDIIDYVFTQIYTPWIPGLSTKEEYCMAIEAAWRYLLTDLFIPIYSYATVNGYIRKEASL